MENRANDPAIINDLIKINNDRIAGYREALDLAHSMRIDDLGGIFAKYILQSEQFINELTPYVTLEGEEPTDSTMLSGKLFRLWMNIKVNISGNDRKSLLESCEKGEDAFKATYRKTLEEDREALSIHVVSLIENQLSKQLIAHDQIKMLRDTISETI
jgi:uncharacterized protein (TIGR02284 family)